MGFPAPVLDQKTWLFYGRAIWCSDETNEKAGVRYFRLHPILHSGASINDRNGVPLVAFQRILIRIFEQAQQDFPHRQRTKEKGVNPVSG